MKTIISAEQKGKTCPPRRIPLSEKMTASKLQNAYDEIADQYEKKIWFDQHILGVAQLRKNLLSKASGKILDVACGTGLNIPLFPVGSDITVVDLSPNMLEVARANATKHGLNVNLAVWMQRISNLQMEVLTRWSPHYPHVLFQTQSKRYRK